ncbi:MAG: methionine synthase, partial [Mycobacterium sp.]|nr:methionine synthase [Mycobacterium sp.]
MTGKFPAGIATGVGSWPGTDSREACRTVLGELPELPHVVELPARGIGADLLGRTGALLVDLAFDTTPRGYRLADRRGASTRRAQDLLRRDLDELESAWQTIGFAEGHLIKTQIAGPWTLAAQVELARGHRVLTDAGALRDLAASLAEGVAGHVAELEKRLNARVVVQFDEPCLDAVIDGTLRGPSTWDPVAAVPENDAVELLDSVLGQCPAPTLLHSCSHTPPLAVMGRTDATALGVPLPAVTSTQSLDMVAGQLDSGRSLVLGLIPTTPPDRPLTWQNCAAEAISLIDRLGFARSVLTQQVAV